MLEIVGTHQSARVPQNADHITPLPFGDLTSLAKPEQFPQHAILWSFHEQPLTGTYFDTFTSLEFAMVIFASALHEQVNLGYRREMNDVPPALLAERRFERRRVN